MSRTKLVVANWKMNLTSKTGLMLIEGFVRQADVRQDVDVVVCPSFTILPRIYDYTRNSRVLLGAQDVFWAESGAFTGRVSASMLYEYCVSHCIVGHSETRGRFGQCEVPETTLGFFAETDETINLKIKSLMYYAIQPILCVGETLAEREAGQTLEIIKKQLAGALDGIDAAELYQFVVAYEPVWAIGTGKTCETPEAERICSEIRAWFGEHFADPELPDYVRVLYGGSVKPSNAHSIFMQPNIDGGLVGGASLSADDFAMIVRVA